MKKLLTLAIASALLAGCGTTPVMVGGPVKARTGVAQAQSKAGVTKGMRGIFNLYFTSYDKDQSGFLTADEAPPQIGFGPQEAPGDPAATMSKLDLNKDGKVTRSEFTRPDIFQPLLAMFRYHTGKEFANLDANGDRVLTPNELEGSAYAQVQVDRNGNGKVTLSEFEDGVSAHLAEHGSLGAAPKPAEPVEPAPGEEPGEDPGEEPSEG